MDKFDIDAFADHLRTTTTGAPNRREAIARELERAIERFGPEAIVEVLEAAIPAGASIGEMIVHQSDDFTLLYARVPPHFQSGIHDHTVCACIGQLTGEERSVVYERNENGEGLRVAERITSRPGEVTTLPSDAIHHIENPIGDIARALHVYGGDFSAVAPDRSLWTHGEHERTGFSFEALVKQSVVAMSETGNTKGLEGLAKAVPAVRPLVDALGA